MLLWVDLGRGVLTDQQLNTIMKLGYARMRRYVTPPRRARSCPRAVRQPVQAWPRLLQARSINGAMDFQLV